MQFHEQRFHEDARRRGFYDIVPGLKGEMNFSHMNPGVICGMHMHRQQTDYFIVAKGSILMRLVYDDGRPEEKFVLSEHTHKTVVIPPGVWHGYKSLEPTVLVFYIDHKFNVDDESRRPTQADEWDIEIR
jgi:dTDP-4-dehydrorhamnose 3,5-epimerase-like enzyme